MVTLRFSSIRKAHAGVYKCVAQDKYGNRYVRDAQIQVLDVVGKRQVYFNTRKGERKRERERERWRETGKLYSLYMYM